MWSMTILAWTKDKFRMVDVKKNKSYKLPQKFLLENYHSEPDGNIYIFTTINLLFRNLAPAINRFI